MEVSINRMARMSMEACVWCVGMEVSINRMARMNMEVSVCLNANGDVDVMRTEMWMWAWAREQGCAVRCGAVRTHGGRALIPALFELPVVVVLRDGAEAVVGQPAHDAVAAHAEDGLLPLLTVGDEGDDVVELAEQAFLPLLGGLLALGRGEHGGDLGPRGWCRCLLLERLNDMVEFCCGREVSVE